MDGYGEFTVFAELLQGVLAVRQFLVLLDSVFVDASVGGEHHET